MPVGEEAQRARFTEIVLAERWVLDSAYGAWLDVVLARADLIVGLDYPRSLSLQRLVRRTVRRVVTREPQCGGNVETLRGVLSADSIIRWHFGSFARKRGRMRAWAASLDGPPVVLCKRPRDLERWIAGLGPA